nr:PREDICTED: uncharacterized protein LOC109033644 [Bemisia tabaci]
MNDRNHELPNRTLPATTATYVGTLKPFEAKVSRSTWLEMLENFCDLNEITEASSKRKVLLNYLSFDVYSELRTQLLPEKPSSKSFDQLVILLQETYEPNKILFSDILKFESRVQAEGETAAVYLTSLRLLADKCNFGDNLKNRLLVKFVNGLNSVNLKKKLWEKSDLTLEDAIKFVRNFETIASELKPASVNKVNNQVNRRTNNKSNSFRPVNRSFNQSSPPQPQSSNQFPATNSNQRTNYRQSNNQRNFNARQPNNGQQSRQQPNRRVNPQTTTQCYRCTRLHNPNYCPARYWKCFNCGIQGHTSTACNQAKAVLEESTDEEIEEIIVGRISNAHLPITKSTSDLQVRNIPSAQLTLAPTSSKSQSNLYVYRVTNNPLLGNIVINDKSVECEFDSGSAVSLMSLSEFSDKFPDSKVEKCTSRLWNVDGQPLNTIGEIKVTVFVQPTRYTLRLIVVKFQGSHQGSQRRTQGSTRRNQGSHQGSQRRTQGSQRKTHGSKRRTHGSQ